MIFCLFTGNFTNYSSGGAIHTLGVGNSIIFEQCTLSANSAPGGDGGAVNLVFTNATFVNSIVFDNPGAYSDDIYLDMGGYAEINYCNLTMPGGATGSNNINENPQFANPGMLDFHLTETSPCIDAGTDIGFEYIGETPDIGCYEFDQYLITNEFQTNDFTVSPNPTTGKINLEFADNNIKQIRISDLTGKTIIEKSEIQQSQTIDLSSFESGIYIINIKTDKEIFTARIVKE